MVLNGENRGSLAVARYLAKQGYNVIVGGNKGLSRTCYSRYAKRRFFYRSTYVSTSAAHEDIFLSVKNLRPDIIFPILSDTTQIILENKHAYEKYCKVIPLIDYERFLIFNDKESMIKEVLKAGFHIPKSYFPKDDVQLKKMSSRLNYPVLLKPRIAGGGKGILKADNSDELTTKYSMLSRSARQGIGYDPSRPLVQEFIRSDNTFTAYVLFDKGRLVQCIVGKNYRHHPLPFGPPVYSIIIRNDTIYKLAVDLFTRLKWHGPANVHFIYDSKENKHKLIEINPRIWATIESSINANANFPLYLCQMALGKKPTISKPAYDKKFRWLLFGDMFYIFKANKEKYWKDDYFSIGKAQTEVDFSDPLPHMVHLFDMIMNRQVL
jgi:predicted ATP-grasp superfamily ATP-dependent carboligase